MGAATFCSSKEGNIKITFLSFYSGRVNRGVETFTHELANNLVDLGNEVTVYQAGEKSDGSRYKIIRPYIVVDWSHKIRTNTVFRKLLSDYWSLKIFQFTIKVVSGLMRKDVDIVIPLNGGWQSVIIRIFSFFKGAKVIISGQSGPGYDDKFNLFTFPDAFVGLTDYQSKWAKKVNSKVRVEKIPNGIDIEKFSLKDSLIKTRLKKPIVLIVSALVAIKRIDLTIKAVAKTNASLLIVGDGELRDGLEVLAQKLIPDRFEFAKYDYQDMPKVYPVANVFAFSTQPWESFGIVMLEAMANNIPVVASDDPIRHEIVSDAGIVVDVENTEAYAKALQKALGKKWGNIPRTRAKEFSWDLIAEKYNNLFKSLLNAN